LKRLLFTSFFHNNIFRLKHIAIIIIIIIIISNLFFFLADPESTHIEITLTEQDSITLPEVINKSPSGRSTTNSVRGINTLGFTENSSGLPSSGDYNFVTYGDFNSDNEFDIAFGGEDWDVQNTVGLNAYTGNGGSAWTGASGGLWTGNSWGGLALADADEDGYIELYACDEDWGSKNNSGVKVWEYRNGSWTDSSTHVSSPDSSGQPCNIVLANITGDSKLDMVVGRFSGVKYFENNGGNPVSWKERSTGLRSSDWFTALAVDDVNKDGLKDIVAGRYSAEHLWIQSTTGNLWQDYSSTVSAPGYQIGAVIKDVNNDTHNDIIFGTTTPSNGNGVYCLLGNSGGANGKTFSWTTANTGLPTSERYGYIQVVDIDLDSDQDIIAPCGTNNNGIEIYLGNGSTNPGLNIGWTKATNINLTQTGDWYSTNCVDINHDGSLDIIAASWGSGVRVWLNNLSRDMTPPAKISDLIGVNVTENSITVNWTAPADNGTDVVSGPVSEYDLRYSKSIITGANWGTRINVANEPEPSLPALTESYTLTGLSVGTQYYIAVRSADEIPNWSPISNVVVNTTLGVQDTTRPGQILDLEAIEPTQNTINLTWTAPADNGTTVSSGSVTEYDIRYYSEEITNYTWPLASKFINSLTPGAPGTTETCHVTSLQPETMYYFAIKARDERPNWGWPSNCANNTTLPLPDDTPPEAIDDLVVSSESQTTISLTWTAPGDDAAAGIANQYDIRYSTTLITMETWLAANICPDVPIPMLAGETENFEVISLLPETKYYFAIRSSDEVPQWSGLSNIATGTTLSLPDTMAPAAITDLAAIDPSSTSISLTWTAPGDDDGKGTATEYDIRYSKAPITVATWESTMKLQDMPIPRTSGAGEAIIVNGLEQNTTYYFIIKTADEVPNWSPFSNLASNTTLANLKPRLTIILTPDQSSLTGSEQTRLVVSILSSTTGKPVSGAAVELISNNPNIIINPNSGVTGADGKLEVFIIAPEVTETVKIKISISAAHPNYISTYGEIVFTIRPPVISEEGYNLHISAENITFSKSAIANGDDLIVFAEITNLGPVGAPEFTVKFVLDGREISTETTIPELLYNGVIKVETNFTAITGYHLIKIEIVLTGDITGELDLSDNAAEKNFIVEGESNVDPDGPKKSDGPKKKDTNEIEFNYLQLVSIIIVIITLILILVWFFILRKRRNGNGGVGVTEDRVEAIDIDVPEEYAVIGSDAKTDEDSEDSSVKPASEPIEPTPALPAETEAGEVKDEPEAQETSIGPEDSDKINETSTSSMDNTSTDTQTQTEIAQLIPQASAVEPTEHSSENDSG
jgi:hypothetical protein